MKNITKFRVLFGAYLMCIPTCLSMLFGNVSAYAFSYFYTRSLTDADTIDPAWMHGAGLIAACTSALVVDLIRTRLGLRLTAAVGIFLTTSAFPLTYFSIQWSAWATAFTFSIIGGLGDGMIGPLTSLYIAGWFEDKSVGLAIAVANSAAGVGGYAFNLILTSYINPENLSPDASRGEITYFTQSDIIQRVPKAFLIVGCATGVLQLIGFCLLGQPRVDFTKSNRLHKESDENKENGHYGTFETSFTESKESNTLCSSCVVSNSSNNHHKTNSNGIERGGSVSATCDEESKILGEASQKSTIVYVSDPRDHNEKLNFLDNKEDKTSYRSNKSRDMTHDMTPKQLLKSKTFYIVWFSYFAESLVLLITCSYYKIFGQLWIKNDTLLTTTGGVASLVSIVSRPICGHLIDRLGVKDTLIIHAAIGAFFLSLWYFTAQYNVWWYFVWTIILFSVCNNQYVMYAISCLKLFGESHYATNLFLVQTSTTTAMLVMPPILRIVLNNFGWFSLFFVCAMAIFVSLVGMIWKMPRRLPS